MLIWIQAALVTQGADDLELTSTTASASLSMVITTSAPGHGVAWPLQAPPLPPRRAGVARSSERFQARSSNPARARLQAIGSPIVPVPKKATLVMIGRYPARGPRETRRRTVRSRFKTL